MGLLYIVAIFAGLGLLSWLWSWIEKSGERAKTRRENEEENRAIEDVLGNFNFIREGIEISELIIRGESIIAGGDKHGSKL
jgi:hypothetical protein